MRRTFAVAALAWFADCLDDFTGDEGDSDDNPVLLEATQEGDLRLESPAFDDGGRIPDQYGRDEANVNPPLEIAAVPTDADSLVLVVDDPDAVEPAGRIWVHWLVWNVPPKTATIPEDWTVDEAIEGENDFGETGYDGPDPPDETHGYRFKLYALDTRLDLEEGATVEDLGEARDGRVVARTQLTASYEP
jgi:Raf kinase inhibitor-like YbhB/YbcL family protein